MNNLFKFRIKAFALIALLLVSLSSAFAQTKIAIIDAGSSGSRLYVYEISQDGKSVTTLCNKKENLPLSKVAVHADSVKAYLQKITQLYDNQGQTPIDLYVLATAGMRYEPKGNAEKIYGYIKTTAQSVNKYCIKEATTISGRYEGLCAWIALNYDCKKIGTSTSTLRNPLTSTPTFGIIEIGGASMQITYTTPDTLTLSKTDSISREGFSRIYSKSFLGGGVDQIYKNFGEGNANTDYSKGNNGINNLPNLTGVNTTFYGLGKPMELVINGMKANGNFENYKATLKPGDEYHPLSNAHYINWLIGQLNINAAKIKIPQNEVSWTKGAALDIVINGEQPEAFDYGKPN